MRFNFKDKFILLSLIIICLSGIFVYSNTFDAPFHYDDEDSIVENPDIKNIADLRSIFQFAPAHFIVYLSLSLNYYFHELNVSGYHLINLMIHLSAGLMVYWLVLLTFSTLAIKDKHISNNRYLLALFSGLLFAAHPVQTEAVTYIIQRSTSLAAFFYITSLTLYIKARLSVLQKAGAGKWFYILSLSAAILGMFSKQIVITLPLIIVLYEYCFFTVRESTRKSSKDIVKVKPLPWKYLGPYFLIMFIVPLNTALSAGKNIWQIGDLTRECEIITRSSYLLTQFRVLVTYLRLFFIPLNQNIDYDYPIAESLWQLPVLAGLLLLLVLLTAGIILFKKYRLISFSIFWFFITLSVESGIIPIRDVIFEHRLYLPMAGYSLFLPVAVYYLCGKKRLKVMTSIMIILISFYSVLTYTRNWVWQSEFALWDDAVRKSPDKGRPYLGRGNAYKNIGMYQEAISDFTCVVKKSPWLAMGYNNRGVIYEETGEFDKAIADYNKALKVKPAYADAYYNLGNVYYRRKEHDKALAYYTWAVNINSEYKEAYNNRGLVYADLGEYEKALADYSQVMKIDPDYSGAYYNRALLFFVQKKYGRALEDIKTVQALGGQIDPDFLEDLKQALGKE